MVQRKHIEFPDGTQPGTKFTIRGKRILKNINNGSQGNFVFTVLVQVPKETYKRTKRFNDGACQKL